MQAGFGQQCGQLPFELGPVGQAGQAIVVRQVVGLALGQGRVLADIVADMRMVAEGIKTTKVAHELGRRIGVETPIIDFMHGVLYEGRPAREAMELMTRSLKNERA